VDYHADRAVPDTFSTEASLMLRPMAVYERLAQQTASGGWWIGLRRPLFVAMLLGGCLSLIVSGRLTARVIVGGAVAWSFIPLFELASFAVVGRRANANVPFSRDVDLFFASHGPWSVSLIAVAAVASFIPMQAATWTVSTPGLITLSAMAATIAIWSGYIDFCFYRAVLGKTGTSAVRALLLQRAIAWTLAVVYFLGNAGWPLVADRLGL
jgi:hypothetical protein